MFTCNCCLRRATRSLVTLDLQTAHPEVLVPCVTKTTISLILSTSTRNHATIASIQKGHHLRVLGEALRSSKELPMKKRDALGKFSSVKRRNDRARAANKHLLDVPKEGGDESFLSKYTQDQGLQTELKWTGGDALKLAQSVLDKLKAGDVQKALEMVRLSEKLSDVEGKKGVDSVISWNHVMDYYMSKSLTREAFKVFNEMKKRGHKPDAHTFTIMLRGYTINHRKPNAVEEAMKVYDSMWRPESNVKPSIIHSNAIINCLGRALNMDALWSVAGRLPDRGPGAADKWTYTTILNTMQACAVRDAGQLAETDGDQEAAVKVIQNAIAEGRKLWEDIVSRWRSGDVNIDQTLVCAMGRLLLLGQKHDWDDIFSLVEQTMRLPRVKPPHIRRGMAKAEELENALALPPPSEENGSAGLEQLEMAVADEAAPKVKNEFGVVDLSDRPVRARNEADAPSPYAHVGNNVLSLLIEASIKLREIPTGKSYWEKLTNSENEPFVMPDEDNVHSYLRLLRISRSSKEICDLLRQPVYGDLEGMWHRRGTFVIAMSTCARDFKNPNAFSYASKILDLMEDKLAEPDLKVMAMYLSLATVTTPGISSEISGDFSGRAGENNLIRAIQRFNYSDLNYTKILAKWDEKYETKDNDDDDKLYVGPTPGKRAHSKHKDKTPRPPPEALVDFMQALNSAYDRVLNHTVKLTEKMATAFTFQKRELSRALARINSDPLRSPGTGYPGDEPADALTEQDPALKSKRYPDKIGRRPYQKIKGPRVVDLEKRHPFTRDMEENSGDEWQPDRRWKSFTSRQDDREDRPRRQGSQSARPWKNNPDERRSERYAESDGPRRNDREGQRPGRDSKSYGSWRNDGEDQRPQRGSESSSLSEGWGNAWKRSMENDGKRKDWVVL